MLDNAYAHGGVTSVIAETLLGLAPSMGVLRTNGFTLVGDGSEPGVIRFEHFGVLPP